MRRCVPLAWFALAALACGAPPPRRLPPPVVPAALQPPAPADPGARGAAYLTTVAAQIQPPWAQFLEDCRLRLAPTHPLNDAALVAVADLAIRRDGTAEVVAIATSRNADFDLAVREVLADTSRLPAPPPELWSD